MLGWRWTVTRGLARGEMLVRAGDTVLGTHRIQITEVLLAASSAILKSGLGGDGHGGRRSAEEVGDVALQTAHDLLVGVAFSSAAGDVGLGREQQRIRVTAMVWMARLRARSAPRLSR
jgi:hypothetical protein